MGPAPTFSVGPGNWFIGEEREVDAAVLRIDKALQCGQIRPVVDAEVKERVRSFQSNPPPGLLHILVWMPVVGATELVVLGGQHSVEAAREIREDLVKRSLPVPATFRRFMARVVSPDAPLVVRQKLAGDHQAAQGTVKDLPMSQVALLLHQQLEAQRGQGGSATQALLDAIQMSGRPRPADWRGLKDLWVPFLHVVQALKENAAPALKKLESGHDAVNLFSFREMRALATPETRLRGAAYLLDPKATVKGFRSHLALEVRRQWADFHWREGNPRISADKRMHLPRHAISSFAEKDQ